MKHIGFAVRPIVCAALLSAVAAFTQQPAATPVGPIPPAILSAKKIFISNAGADSGLFPSPFSGTPDRGYSELYAGFKATGQYELVSDPGQADLVLELQLIAPNGPTNGNKVYGASDPVPMFRLVVYDPKTHFVLWAFTESINIAYLQKSHDHNFDDAVKAIQMDFQMLSGTAHPAAP